MDEVFDTFQFEVMRLLKKYPETRVSDDRLVELWLKEKYGIKFRFNDVGLSMGTIKTLERCRRKVQAHNPELKDMKADFQRQLLEEDHRSYFKKGFNEFNSERW